MPGEPKNQATGAATKRDVAVAVAVAVAASTPSLEEAPPPRRTDPASTSGGGANSETPQTATTTTTTTMATRSVEERSTPSRRSSTNSTASAENRTNEPETNGKTPAPPLRTLPPATTTVSNVESSIAPANSGRSQQIPDTKSERPQPVQQRQQSYQPVSAASQMTALPATVEGSTVVGMVGTTPIVRLTENTRQVIKKRRGRFTLLQNAPETKNKRAVKKSPAAQQTTATSNNNNNNNNPQTFEGTGAPVVKKKGRFFVTNLKDPGLIAVNINPQITGTVPVQTILTPIQTHVQVDTTGASSSSSNPSVVYTTTSQVLYAPQQQQQQYYAAVPQQQQQQQQYYAAVPQQQQQHHQQYELASVPQQQQQQPTQTTPPLPPVPSDSNLSLSPSHQLPPGVPQSAPIPPAGSTQQQQQQPQQANSQPQQSVSTTHAPGTMNTQPPAVQHAAATGASAVTRPTEETKAIVSEDTRAKQPARTSRKSASSQYARPAGLAAQTGLGKVFYFLDQMRSEVTEADRTIKSLQTDIKSLQTDIKFLKEKNKELEAKARDAERKMTEEKALRQAAEGKTKALRKKLRALKESTDADLPKETHEETRSRKNSEDIDAELVVDLSAVGSGDNASLGGDKRHTSTTARAVSPTVDAKAVTSNGVGGTQRTTNSAVTDSTELSPTRDHQTKNTLSQASSTGGQRPPPTPPLPQKRGAASTPNVSSTATARGTSCNSQGRGASLSMSSLPQNSTSLLQNSTISKNQRTKSVGNMPGSVSSQRGMPTETSAMPAPAAATPIMQNSQLLPKPIAPKKTRQDSISSRTVPTDFDPHAPTTQKSDTTPEVMGAGLPMMSSTPMFVMNQNTMAVPVIGLSENSFDGIDTAGFSSQPMMHVLNQPSSQSLQGMHDMDSQHMNAPQNPYQQVDNRSVHSQQSSWSTQNIWTQQQQPQQQQQQQQQQQPNNVGHQLNNAQSQANISSSMTAQQPAPDPFDEILNRRPQQQQQQQQQSR